MVSKRIKSEKSSKIPQKKPKHETKSSNDIDLSNLKQEPQSATIKTEIKTKTKTLK